MSNDNRIAPQSVVSITPDWYLTAQDRIEHLRYSLEVIARMYYTNPMLAKLIKQALNYKPLEMTLADVPTPAELEDYLYEQLVPDTDKSNRNEFGELEISNNEIELDLYSDSDMNLHGDEPQSVELNNEDITEEGTDWCIY